ncbi:neprilysin-1-like isoform X2 [Dermatophagoides pteronyssinus]|uniref:neprilysin-1-like isoform X2 n=1 Tax=Dermatophagoides pteronyssinus TaxID=6956 RepID=UPI003F6791CC
MKVTTTNILSFSSIILLITLLFNNIVHHIYDHDNAMDMFCMTETCDNYSENVLKLINNSVDPCDNFHQYACGTMIRNVSDRGYITDLIEKVRDEVEYILKKGWDQKKNKTNRKIVKSRSLATDLAIRIFQQCTRITSKIATKEEILEAINKQFNGLPISTNSSWPLESNKNSININWLDFYAHYSNAFGYEPIFRVGYYLLINLYIQIDFCFMEFQIFNCKVLLEFMMPNKTNEKSEKEYEKICNEVIDFSVKLTKFKLKFGEKKLYHLKEIESDTGLNWESFFQITLNYGKSFRKEKNPSIIYDNELIIVEDALLDALKFIENTPKHIVFNYFWLKTIAYFLSNIKTTGFCPVSFFSDQFPLSFAIARLYVDYSLKPGSKLKAIHMVNQLKQSAIESIEKNTLFDDETREKAIEKLRSIIDFVGLPEKFMIDEQLDEFYGLQSSIDPMFGDNYYESYAKLLRHYKHIMFGKMGNDSISLRGINSFSPLIFNGYYSMLANSIEIKPILLRLPLFDTELPFYVNYAKLGYIIGHEIFHCVDKTGIKYDKSGALREWTTDKFEKKYDDKTQCFIEQYRNYTEHYYGLSQDNSTVGEDVADNGGLRVAYMAYQHEMKRIQNLGKQPQLFPKLVDKKMTVEQIFFLATAQFHCRFVTRTQLNNWFTRDSHSPPESRVNVCLQNFDKFAESFNCSIGSPMNPEKRCRLF